MIDKRLILHKIKGEHNYNTSSGICGVCGKKETVIKHIFYDKYSNAIAVPDELANIETITKKCEELWRDKNIRPEILRVSAKGANILIKEMASNVQYITSTNFPLNTDTMLNTPFNSMVVKIIT